MAITRARDALILTGHIGKAAALEKHRQAGRPGAMGGGDEGSTLAVALSEDVLLKGTTALVPAVGKVNEKLVSIVNQCATARHALVGDE